MESQLIQSVLKLTGIKCKYCYLLFRYFILSFTSLNIYSFLYTYTFYIEIFRDTFRHAMLALYLPDFCQYMSNFLLVIANYLFEVFITLFKDSKDDNLLTVIVIKKAFHQKIQYHGIFLDNW